MKKILIILSFMLLFLVVFGLLIFKNNTKPQNISYEKKVNKNFIENKNIKDEAELFDINYCEKSIEKVSGHEFWCYTTPSCYDTNTYKYNAVTDTYAVDYMFDYNLSGNFDYNHSPYDDGYITHLIFGTTFSPSKKQFNAQYKGFITSKLEDNKENGGYYNKLLNIYYDNNPHLIPNLEWHIKNFNEISKNVNHYYPLYYSIEVTQCIPKQLKP